MIQPGQIYRAADGSGTLIRILLAPEIVLGRPYGTAVVETVLATGRGVRRRTLLAAALHTSSLNGGGQPWSTGYILDPDSAHATTEQP